MSWETSTWICMRSSEEQIPFDAWINSPQYGDEIAVFDVNGSIVGAAVFTGIKNKLVAGFNAVIDWFASLPSMILDAIVNSVVDVGKAISDWWKGLWD